MPLLFFLSNVQSLCEPITSVECHIWFHLYEGHPKNNESCRISREPWYVAYWNFTCLWYRSIYTFSTKLNTIAWRHTVWRQAMAFIFVPNVWIDLYHRHIKFQYATYHGSRDIRQLSLFLGWPSYNMKRVIYTKAPQTVHNTPFMNISKGYF